MATLIYRKTCYFYRKTPDGSRICAVNKRCCFTCPLFTRKIEGLDLKDHVNVALVAITARRSVLFSFLALIISMLTLAFKIIESFSAEVGNLFQHILGGK